MAKQQQGHTLLERIATAIAVRGHARTTPDRDRSSEYAEAWAKAMRVPGVKPNWYSCLINGLEAQEDEDLLTALALRGYMPASGAPAMEAEGSLPPDDGGPRPGPRPSAPSSSVSPFPPPRAPGRASGRVPARKPR